MGAERARQIYSKAKHKQMRAYVARIKERTGEKVSFHKLWDELGERIKVTQYLEEKYGEVLRDS